MYTPALTRSTVCTAYDQMVLDPEPSMENTEDSDVHYQQEAVEDAPDDYPPYVASFPPLIQHLIDAERARK